MSKNTLDPLDPVLQQFNRTAEEARAKYKDASLPQLLAHAAIMSIHLTILHRLIEEKTIDLSNTNPLSAPGDSNTN